MLSLSGSGAGRRRVQGRGTSLEFGLPGGVEVVGDVGVRGGGHRKVTAARVHQHVNLHIA